MAAAATSGTITRRRTLREETSKKSRWLLDMVRCHAAPGGRPGLGLKAFVDDQAGRPRREHLQRLHEFDQRVLLGRRQLLKGATLGQRFAVVREHRLAQRREPSVMEERRFVRGTPQALGQE